MKNYLLLETNYMRRFFTIILAIIGMTCYSQDKVGLLDSLFHSMHNRNQFCGNVLISEKNEIIYSKSFGLADRENERLLNETTLFNIGSVSKAFTAIAILQLAERNKIQLSDKVVKYLPQFPYPEISIHHLLIHAGGLPKDCILLDKLDKNKIASNSDIFKILFTLKPPLIFTPGEKSEYSNLGYMILSEIIEKTSENDFKEYIKKNIFSPANMQRTYIYNADEIKQVKNVAKGYIFYPFSSKYEEAIKIPEFASNYIMSGFQGDGNVYSTTIDLFRFYKALSSNKLISKETLDDAFKKHISAHMQEMPDFGNSYGYGWLILNTPMKIVNRGGELPGYVSNTIWNMNDNRLIIYLINDYLSYTSYQNQIPIAVAGILNQRKLQIPKLIASIELTKFVMNCSTDELSKRIDEIKSNPDIYEIDLPGLKFLVEKLEQMGNTEKTVLIMNSFKPE